MEKRSPAHFRVRHGNARGLWRGCSLLVGQKLVGHVGAQSFFRTPFTCFAETPCPMLGRRRQRHRPIEGKRFLETASVCALMHGKTVLDCLCGINSRQDRRFRGSERLLHYARELPSNQHYYPLDFLLVHFCLLSACGCSKRSLAIGRTRLLPPSIQRIDIYAIALRRSMIWPMGMVVSTCVCRSRRIAMPSSASLRPMTRR